MYWKEFPLFSFLRPNTIATMQLASTPTLFATESETASSVGMKNLGKLKQIKLFEIFIKIHLGIWKKYVLQKCSFFRSPQCINIIIMYYVLIIWVVAQILMFIDKDNS